MYLVVWLTTYRLWSCSHWLSVSLGTPLCFCFWPLMFFFYRHVHNYSILMKCKSGDQTSSLLCSRDTLGLLWWVQTNTKTRKWLESDLPWYRDVVMFVFVMPGCEEKLLLLPCRWTEESAGCFTGLRQGSPAPAVKGTRWGSSEVCVWTTLCEAVAQRLLRDGTQGRLSRDTWTSIPELYSYLVP